MTIMTAIERGTTVNENYGYTLWELYRLWLNFRYSRDEVSQLCDFACCDRPKAEIMIEAFRHGKLPEPDPRLRKMDAAREESKGKQAESTNTEKKEDFQKEAISTMIPWGSEERNNVLAVKWTEKQAPQMDAEESEPIKEQSQAKAGRKSSHVKPRRKLRYYERLLLQEKERM